MTYDIKRLAKLVVVSLTLVVPLVFITFFTVNANARDQMELYITPKTEYLPVGKLLSHLLESRLEIKVQTNIQYSEVGLRKTANGEADLFIGLKSPPVGEVPWTYSLNQFCDLGPIYEDVVAGWGVPSYIPKDHLDSLTDLGDKQIRSLLHGEILVHKSEKKLLEESNKLIQNKEGLNGYKLVKVREIVAISELSRTIRNKEWILVTLKRPSIPFSLHEIRFIKELTHEQSVHLLGRTDLMGKYSSEVTQFLSRFYLSIELVGELVRLYDQDKSSAVNKFVERHPAIVEYWVKGVEGL